MLSPCVQFSLQGASALTKRIEFLEQMFQLGIEITGALCMRLRVCAERGVALAQEVQLLDLFDHFRVLRVRRGNRDCTLSLLRERGIMQGRSRMKTIGLPQIGSPGCPPSHE
jgi:hypothetical protein